MKATYKSHVKTDIIAGLVVFLVALPLCLGIALASGAPLFSGIISGIIGGIVVGFLSNSQLSVSGPAAGLTAIVFSSISSLGSFQTFLLAVVLAGIIQIILGLIKAGTVSNYFPSNVIEGMLAAIGIIIILKQLPHAIGYDKDNEGDFAFIENTTGNNTLTAITDAINYTHFGALLIAVVCIIILILFQKITFLKSQKLVPGGLAAVTVGTVINEVFVANNSSYTIEKEHLVSLPVAKDAGEFFNQFIFPDFTAIANIDILITAFTIAIVASIETLLCLEATDKMDPLKRFSNSNTELKAQGIGNIISGLLGGIPMTSVIVRTTTNISSGGRTKIATIAHGLFLLLAVVLIPDLLNKIPLASLAAILIMVGYKLASPAVFKHMWHAGKFQFIPFLITIFAVVFTDLLKGVAIGLVFSILYILWGNMRFAYVFKKEKHVERETVRIKLAQEVSFLNKAAIKQTLSSIPSDVDQVIIDASDTVYIDYDVLELIRDFQQNADIEKNILCELVGFKEEYRIENTQFHVNDFTQKLSAMNEYNKLLENNKQWAERKTIEDPDFFKRLENIQTPKFLWIGCSDSRVPADTITGTQPGEIFIHRNIANMVVHTDFNMLSVLEYAVLHLKVEHVIVCGHYGCGGVKAALSHHNFGLLNKWLRNIKDVYKLHQEEIDNLPDEKTKLNRMIEINVKQQVLHLAETSIVQKAWKERGAPHLHGWVYDLHDGVINTVFEMPPGTKIDSIYVFDDLE